MYLQHWLPGRETWIYYLIVILFVMSVIRYERGKTQWAKPLIERRVDEKMANVSSDLPHKTYQAIEDSVRRKVSDENFDNLSVASSKEIAGLGVSRKKRQADWNYYFYSDGYQLDANADFYTDGEKNYIEWNQFTEGRPGEKHKDETRLRVVRQDAETDKVLFPVSETTYTVILVLYFIIFLVLAYFGFRIFFGYTRQLLKNISTGKVFTADNIFYLRSVAVFLIVLGTVPPVVKIAVNLFLQSSVPSTLHFSWYNALMQNSYAVICGLVVLLFVRAFRQGEALSEEHELTV